MPLEPGRTLGTYEDGGNPDTYEQLNLVLDWFEELEARAPVL